jgi:hypothetical protein
MELGKMILSNMTRKMTRLYALQGIQVKGKLKLEEQAQVKIHALPFTLIQTSAKSAL